MDWCHIRPKNLSCGLEITMSGSISKVLIVFCVLFYQGKVSTGIAISMWCWWRWRVSGVTLRCYKTSYMSEWRSLVPCNHPDDTCIIFGQYSVATTAIFSSGPSTVSNLFNRENNENVEFLPLETFNMDQSPSPSPDSIYLVLLFVDTPGLSYF